MKKDIIVFEAIFRSAETSKELSYYISVKETDAWETALAVAKQHEESQDNLLLIELKYLGIMLPLEYSN